MDKAVWIPPEPCLDPASAGIESCDVDFDIDPITAGIQSHWEVHSGDPDMTAYNLFCAGHPNLPPNTFDEFFYPRTLVVGGSVPNDPNQGVPGAFVFWEALPDVAPSVYGDYDWTEVADLNFYRWYPTATVLADGRSTATGDAGGGDDDVVVLDLCEVMPGESLDGGAGSDTLWLPDGVRLVDVQAAGASVIGFESVQTLQGGAWGMAECTL